MIDFWLAAGLLLLIALSFLLIPVLRGRRAQREEDRTALNVALYQERVAELQVQQDEGVLNAAQLDTGRAEAARELLADTEGVEKPRESRLGKPLPLLAAVLVPVLGLGLYMHFGASDKVELTREFSQPPVSMEDMTRRLERAAAAQPDSAEGLYFLGRAYMAQDRSADAAKVFERTVALAGRQPQAEQLFSEAIRREPEAAISWAARGITRGNLLIFAGLDSTRTADLTVASFAKVGAGTMNGVRVLFIGSAADSERVKAVVEPTGSQYVFIDNAV